MICEGSCECIVQIMVPVPLGVRVDVITQLLAAARVRSEMPNLHVPTNDPRRRVAPKSLRIIIHGAWQLLRSHRRVPSS